MWSGTLISIDEYACTTNQFVLRHNSFESGFRECNSDNQLIIRGTRISQDDNGSQCYTSQLSFIANSSHESKTIVCSHQNGHNETIINYVSIAITRGISYVMCSMIIFNSKFVFRSLASP